MLDQVLLADSIAVWMTSQFSDDGEIGDTGDEGSNEGYDNDPLPGVGKPAKPGPPVCTRLFTVIFVRSLDGAAECAASTAIASTDVGCDARNISKVLRNQEVVRLGECTAHMTIKSST